MSAAIKLSSPATRGFWEIPVLFEDAHLLALDKPGGLSVSPDDGSLGQPALMRLLHDGIAAGKPWAGQRNLAYLDPAHRPDSDATGVLLLAKTKGVSRVLADLFSAGKSVEKYLALAWGNPPEKHFMVDAKLAPHALRAGQMCVDPDNGKKAHTDFEVLEQFSGWCLLACFPQAGRGHQIRVHLKHAGFPVVGDETYGGRKLWLSRLKKDFRLKAGREERPLASRAVLHLGELTLPHPVTGETLAIRSDWPKPLMVALKYLRQYAA